MTTCPISAELLNAYVDSELAPDASETISAHLASCARCSTEYQSLLATVAALRSSLVRHRAPDVLRARVRGAIAAQPLSENGALVPLEPPHRSRRWPRWATAAAAAIVCVALGSGTTFLALRQASPSSVAADEVLASHLRSLMPEHLTDIRSTDQHNVKPWFNGRLDFSPSVPRLDSLGFPLIGGRLDYVGERAVASVVYGRRQHIINVFSWPTEAGDAPVSFTASHGYNMLHWRERGVEQWVVSDVNAPELRSFSDLLRKAER
jgi:anti-sigma factor RsiW